MRVVERAGLYPQGILLSTTNKTGPGKDPFRAREEKKYERPIASREYVMQLLAEQSGPVTLEGFARLLHLEKANDIEALRRRLRAMERDGQVIRNRRQGYGLVSKMDLVRGRVIGHRDGFGFVVPDEGGEDVYLSSRQMRSLIHGDRVVVCVTGVDVRNRREGALVEVLERNTQRLVGRFVEERGICFVVPDNGRINHDVHVPRDQINGARDGDIVTVDILEQPERRSPPIGKVAEVLGAHMAPGMEVDIAIRSHDLPVEWPDAVLEEAEQLGDRVKPAQRRGRVDLRDLPLVTIDGEDARDFDDAVYCAPTAKGWRLLVAIADVSAYVKPGSALDEQAKLRGNSTYFPDRVIPMLPETLSNGLCSLNPDVDRLCMVCELYITSNGAIRRSKFFEAVMRSHARLTYTEVAAALFAKDKQTRSHLGSLTTHLDQLHNVYLALAGARAERGAMDIDMPETLIIYDEDSKISSIERRVRNDAHRIIEECMIAANVAAARFVLKAKIPSLFRVHEGPSNDKLTELRAFLQELGLRLGGGSKPQASHFASLLDRTRERLDADLIQGVLLRSLSQAVYQANNAGHFGLALEAYAHFTSPIRRYPDLLLHRAIRHVVRGRPIERFDYKAPGMTNFGEHASMTERRSDEATRDALDWLKCEFMQDKVGQVYDATVSAVTSFGLFMVLDEVFVEGLVHISSLGRDYFHFDPAHHRLLGERTGQSYKLSDRLKVQVTRVDLDERKIDFELWTTDRRGHTARRSRGRGARRRRK